MIIKPTRRGFLIGLGALLAAPAIVRATSIMPVKALPAEVLKGRRQWHHVAITRAGGMPVVWVDGGLVDPTCLKVWDSGWHIYVPNHKLLLNMPPEGSHQSFMMPENT